MYNSFIPSYHFVAPEKKLTPEWCWDAVTYCWYNTNNINLLVDKNVEEIKQYATGKIDMRPFKRMFKSQSKAMDRDEGAYKNDPNYRHLNTTNTIGIGFEPLPLIPSKINSAWAIVQKEPVEVTVTAQDPLAAKKKNEDLTFLKNKPTLEAQLQQVADAMNVGQVDLGTTKHSAIPFSDSPYGLDLNEPEELQVFVDLLYNLSVDSSFETALQQWWELKNGYQIKELEIKDHLYYGVSAHKTFRSSLTALPDIQYVYPGNVSCPYSQLPDYSDRTHDFEFERPTVLALFNQFGNEICSEDDLINIINGKEFGYCDCNGIDPIPYDNFGSYKINLVYCEIKSVDYVGIAPLNKKSKFNYVVADSDNDKKCTDKIWGQNTYGFWWLQNTKHFFGIHRLDFSHRTKGQECFQGFSKNIYKSQERSAVELSISENKKAQVADIKMQHAILKSLPPGRYIDLRFMRNAVLGLTEENNKYTQQDLINLAMEQNFFIGDTQDFDGKNDGQFKPFIDIPGGIKTEVVGYMQVIADASSKISQFTGINENIIGQKAEELVGNQQALINAGINALYYISLAMEKQEQKLFTNWASIIQTAIKEGGKAKQAIVDLVGAKKATLIDSLDDIPIHRFGIKVTINGNEENKIRFERELQRLELAGVVTPANEFMVTSVTNAKDKLAMLAVIYKQWQKRTDKQRLEDQAQQQAMIQSQGQNQQNALKAKMDGEVQKIYAQGDVNSKILQLASQLGIQSSQFDFLGKKALQQDRGNDQLQKNVQTLQTKADLENQKPV